MITSIKYAGEAQTVDMEVANTHSYQIALNDKSIVSHNTLSLLGNCTPGCHPGIYPHYIRRIRMSSDSALVDICKKHGYTVEDQINFDGTVDHDTKIPCFPCKFPKDTTFAKDMGAIAQMDVVRRLQREWSDNSVSCCLAKDHYVHTTDGFVDIAQLAGNRVGFNSSRCTAYNMHGMTEVSEFGYVNGDATVLKITLENGKTITGTPNHKLLCNDKWKELKDLTMTDVIDVVYGLDKWFSSKVCDMETAMCGTRSEVCSFVMRIIEKYTFSSNKKEVRQLDTLMTNLGFCGTIERHLQKWVYTVSDKNAFDNFRKTRASPAYRKQSIPIASIRALSKRPTFDISMGATKSYLVSGVISHNTVYFKPEELKEIKSYLAQHYTDNIKSISFMLHSEHGFAQAPYEEITEEQYEQMSSCVSMITASSVKYSKKDDELASIPVCAGGSCPIK